MRTHPLEVQLKKEGFFCIAGIDEVGRGPWAGPLVAAAVILKPNTRIPDLNDSKKLNEFKRHQIFSVLVRKADIGIGIVSKKTVDTKGLTYAQKMAYKKAIDGLTRQPNYLLIDGIGKYSFKIPSKTVKKGDTKVRVIAAASVVAKVVRDLIMDSYSLKYPKYGFNKHKGYGTRHHQQKLLEYGVSRIHRKSFLPIKQLINEQKER